MDILTKSWQMGDWFVAKVRLLQQMVAVLSQNITCITQWPPPGTYVRCSLSHQSIFLHDSS